jgi:hypothetical protein
MHLSAILSFHGLGLGLGEHRLQIQLQGYMVHSTLIKITQQTQ